MYKYVNVHTHTHKHTVLPFIYLSIPVQRTHHLNYSNFITFWSCGKAILSLLFFLFKIRICLAMWIFSSRWNLESACQIPQVKPCREASTTAQDRIRETGSTLLPETTTTKPKQNIWNKFHWTSGNEGQWSVRYRKQIKWALQLPQFTA